MQWMISINQLGAQQARILDDVSKDDTRTHWIAGYAGTGKTVVITHLIERMIARTRSPIFVF
jgi:Ni2+-binding GTPase involved in maturation of urease and hydrogenase